MKVVLLTRAIYPLHGHGGLERHTSALKKHLERAGCDVVAVTPPPDIDTVTPRPDVDTMTRRGPAPDAADGSFRFVPYRTIDWPREKGFVVLDRITNYVLWSLRAGRLVAEELAADIVQADGGAGFGYARARRNDPKAPPLVLHPHGMEEFKTTPAKRALYWPLRSAVRYAAKRADCVIAPDASMEPDVREILSVSDDRLKVLPNAIDLENVDSHAGDADLSSLGLDDSQAVLLSVGRLESNKGFVEMADALGRVKTSLPPRWRWVLVGRGPEKETIETAVHDRGIAENVSFVGSVQDDVLFSLYQRADLFVHPTLYEGSSMVTLEAMARSKAIVASRVGGIPDKVEDGVSGWLVPPADVGALAQAVTEALSDRERLTTYGRAARRAVEERFSWASRIGELVALYEKLIATPRIL